MDRVLLLRLSNRRADTGDCGIIESRLQRTYGINVVGISASIFPYVRLQQVLALSTLAMDFIWMTAIRRRTICCLTT